MVGIVVGIGVTLARSAWFFVVGPEAVAIAALPDPAAATLRPFNVEAVAGANLFGDPALAVPRTRETELQDTPDTRLNLALAAVYQAERPEDSLAVISAGGASPEPYRIGDAVPGNAKLVEIHRGQVVISRDGIRERLRFDEDPPMLVAGREDDGAAQAPPPPLPARPRGGTPPPVVPRMAQDGWDGAPEAPEAALQAMGLAAVSGSAAHGYRVDQLGDSPHLAGTGLQSGDVILSVNGRPVGNLSQDQMQLGDVVGGGAVRLEIQRGERRFFVTAALP